MFARNWTAWVACGVASALLSACPIAARSADVVFKVVMVEDEDGNPAAAGKAAATALKEAMGGCPLKAVLVSECFEDQEPKAELLKGICEVLPKELVLGGATYGSFTQEGCTDFDAVCLLGIGGERVQASTQLVTEMGTSKLTFEKDQELIRQRLHAAGEKLAGNLARHDNDKLLIVVADAHSPKVQYLVEGVQKKLGNDFPITGGCANKNAGQTFVYYDGRLWNDAAVALMLSGDFSVALSGRMANDEQAVIRTAGEGAQEVLEKAKAKPDAVLSFNCAGRRSKLKKYEEELASMQKVLGSDVTLFGCYCAGEIGPVDEPGAPKDVLSGGSGWHVMFTTITAAK
ncbi:MAG: FIST N-terminal domain-containing protein [Thermoguttaceae bacterium]